jgi:two-component system response regulator YesN
MKVIIIDDEPVHVRGLMKYVKWNKFGFDKVVGVSSAKEALKLLQEETFDLVVTDINMPGMNGLELIRQIHVYGKNPDIIIVSGYNEFTYAQEAIRLGVCAYILKPIKPEEMEDNIQIIAEKKKWLLLDEEKKSEFDILSQIIEEENMKSEGISVEGVKVTDLKAEKKAENINVENANTENMISENMNTEHHERKTIHPSIQKILIYIGKNFASDITVQEIAEEFRLNECYLSALFKKEVGINLSNYLQRYRVNRAMELLKNSDLRINEIAYKVGYQNPSYFSEQFKKIYNITPSEIRREVLI